MRRSRSELFPAIDFVFLDRDGVINRKAPDSEYVFRWDDFQLLPNVESAIAKLNHSGRHVIVITNQRGVSLGLYTLQDVTTLHSQLQQHLASAGAHIDAFYVCPHDRGQCDCRKPKAGLLEQAFRDFSEATKQNSLLVGDSLSDIQLARTFGIPSIFIKNSQERNGVDQIGTELASASSSSLAEAVENYLR